MTILYAKRHHSRIATTGYNNSNKMYTATTTETVIGKDPRYVAATIVVIVNTKTRDIGDTKTTIDIGDTKVIDTVVEIITITADTTEEIITTTINNIGIMGTHRHLRRITIDIIIIRRGGYHPIVIGIVMMDEIVSDKSGTVTTHKIIVDFNRTILIFHDRVLRYMILILSCDLLLHAGKRFSSSTNSI